MEFQSFMEQIHEHILLWMMFLISNYANSDGFPDKWKLEVQVHQNFILMVGLL